MLANGIASLSHVMEIYFSRPDEDNVSDDLAEALMKSIIRNLKKAAEDSENYEARSNLLWASALAKNRIIKVGKRGDSEVVEGATGPGVARIEVSVDDIVC